MTDNQKTVQSEISITGVGLHTGNSVTITIKPAPENHGYKFIRTDIEGAPEITATVDNVVETKRGTTLEENNARVYTTEHVLAALYGMGIDNALIEINGPEVPILDGSAKPFVDGIISVGIKEQNAEKNYFVLKENITFEDEEKGVEMLAVPSEDFRITVMVDYNSPLLGTQHASMYHLGEFKDEIAPCRTFVFLREIEALYNQGLIKGGDVDNAIVMIDKETSDEELWHLASLFGKSKEDIAQYHVKGIGFLNNLKLHFENEPARHKLLDIVGDLALVGQPIKAHILAARPGHAGNVAFAKIITNLIKKEKRAVPKFDLNKESIYDINDIK
ncbi:MAG: UDP-3-O-[3-hydroxymyristoyl] N-acetylglucosamine deacetylase, partial [Bacteroidetes bacterium]